MTLMGTSLFLMASVSFACASGCLLATLLLVPQCLYWMQSRRSQCRQHAGHHSDQHRAEDDADDRHRLDNRRDAAEVVDRRVEGFMPGDPFHDFGDVVDVHDK